MRESVGISAVRTALGRAINGTSIVLAVSLGRQRILLTADLEDDHDADLLEIIPDDGHRWDLLKVAHHGSAYSTSEAFLSAVTPQHSVISVGAENAYDHPSEETLGRLDASGTAVHRTDLDGTITFRFSPDGSEIAPILIYLPVMMSGDGH